MATNEEIIVSGLIPEKPDRIKEALANISYCFLKMDDSYITGKLKVLYDFALKYYLKTGGVLDRDIVTQLLADLPYIEEEKLELVLMFEELKNNAVPTDKFKFAVERLKQDRIYEKLSQMLMRVTVVLEDTRLKEGVESAYKQARTLLEEDLIGIDKQTTTSYPVEVMRDSVKTLWKEYKERKEGIENTKSVYTGFTVIDELTNGFQPGELVVIGGYAGTGKSFTLLNIAHNAAIKYKKNVAIASLEMTTRQYRQRMITRFSCNPELNLKSGQGLDYESLKKGKLTDVEEEDYKKVLTEMHTNPDYGNVIIFQMPYGETINYLRAKLHGINALYPLDLFILDYYSLLSPLRKRGSSREECSEIIESCKQLALDFDKGKGIALITAAHFNRKSYEEACKKGHSDLPAEENPEEMKKYNIHAFLETSAIENSCDFAMWEFRGPDQIRDHKLLAGVLKNRDSKIINHFYLQENFAKSYIGNDDGGISQSTLRGPELGELLRGIIS
jgi:replicative DNA helicase